jgi:hypothetical protein
MDKQESKCTEMNEEERKEMVNTDRERCASSYKPDVFYFRIEDNPKVESGDVSEMSVPFCQSTLRHIAKTIVFIFIEKRA